MIGYILLGLIIILMLANMFASRLRKQRISELLEEQKQLTSLFYESHNLMVDLIKKLGKQPALEDMQTRATTLKIVDHAMKEGSAEIAISKCLDKEANVKIDSLWGRSTYRIFKKRYSKKSYDLKDIYKNPFPLEEETTAQPL